MPAPELSVVISTHNRPVQVRETIASIVHQDHPGIIETLVVFDKSEPDPDLESDDPKRPVRVLANDQTPGLPGSRNCGALAAHGAFVGFSDDDDLWAPTKARLQLELIERTGAPTVGCSVEIFAADGTKFPFRTSGSAARFEDLIRKRIPEASMGCVVVRRDALLGPIGLLDPDIPGGYAEDYEWWLRAARHSPIPLVQEPLYRVLWTGSSFYRHRWDAMDQASAALLEEFPEFRSDPHGLGTLQGRRAFALAAQGRRSDAVALIRESLAANWREPRALLALLVVAGVPAPRVLAVLNSHGRGI